VTDYNTWLVPGGATQQGVLDISWSPSTFTYNGTVQYPTATITRADSGGNNHIPTPTYGGSTNATAVGN